MRPSPTGSRTSCGAWTDLADGSAQRGAFVPGAAAVWTAVTVVSGSSRLSWRRLAAWAVPVLGAATALVWAGTLEKMRLGAPLVVIVAGGLALALCALAAWRMLDPLVRPETSEPVSRQRPRHLRELEREKQAVLKAIKELELDHQMRKVADEDFRDMMDRYRARALRVMSQLEAGGAAEYRELIEHELRERLTRAGDAGAAATAAPDAASASSASASTGSAKPGEACGACGTSNDADAVFCKRCGSKLAAGVGA